MLFSLLALTLASCATLPQRDPPQVTVAGVEPLQGQGLELRLLVKMRVQTRTTRRSTTTASTCSST